VILSKDKGFDPLIKHLVRRGFAVRRANSDHRGARLARTASCRAARCGRCAPGRRPRGRTRRRWGAARGGPATARGKRRRSAAPRKRKGLIAVLHSHFSKKVPESELLRLVDKLIAGASSSESNGAITYHSERSWCRSGQPTPEPPVS